VSGLIDFVLLLVVFSALEAITNRGHALSGAVQLAVVLGYFGYFWSSRGQSIGMMVFGFKVRDQATGRYPSVGKAVWRGFVWWVEAVLTVCLIGALGWLWMLWDPQKQAIHDKVAGTIVTTG